MQFIDLAAQQKLIREQIEANLRAVLDHGRYIMGPEVGELEEKLAQFTGAPCALGCGSGTDALLLALMALEIGPGDAVFCPTFTFIATAEVVSLLGATPVFVDVEADTFNMDPAKLAQAVRALRSNDPGAHPLPKAEPGSLTPKAIIAVDLFGLPADYQALTQVAREEGLVLVEDAAQSLGSRRDGVRAGAMAPLTATSFFPAKPLGGYGDGGMVFCQDPELLAIMKSLRVHGQGTNKYDNVRIGLNARLDTMQAAVLLAKLELFEDELTRRQEVAARYAAKLEPLGLVQPPRVPEGYLSAWAQYSVLAPDAAAREELMGRLQKAGVPSAIYYPKPLHLQPAFAGLGYQPGDFAVSEDLAGRVFSLPMHPYLSHSDQDRVVAALAQA